MKECKLILEDEVNCKFEGLDPATRRKMVNKMKYFVPWAYHTPSYKLGRWDGTISFCSLGAKLQINLLENVLPIVEEKYDINLIDNRNSFKFDFEKIDENVISHKKWPIGHERENDPIVLREHQVKIINDFLENPQSIVEASTASGKTIITAVLSYIFEKLGRTIVIVPTKNLVVQTEQDYKNIGLDVGVYYGDRKEIDHQHVICTWQSIEALNKKGKKFNQDLVNVFLEDVVCVMVDEVHNVRGDTLHGILCNSMKNIPIRLGLTGTIPSEEYFYFNLLGAIGPVTGSVTAKELQDKEILSNCFIDICQIKEPLDFKEYKKETDYLVKDTDRLEFISENIIKKAAENGNTLVLVDKIETGEKLNKLIENSVFISGNMKSEDRKKHYDSINNNDNMVLIATCGVCSTGINVPRLFNVILIEPGKSYIKIIQSIGRGLRKAKDKDFVHIYDVCSTTKYSKKHLTERKKHYKKVEYDFKVTKYDRQTL